MAESEVESDAGGSLSSDSSDFEDDGQPGFDPLMISKMPDRERKKWEQTLKGWRSYMDFLVRHVAICTFKYNCFELKDSNHFMTALKKADTIKRKAKRKKGGVKPVSSFKAMKDASELLMDRQEFAAAKRVKKFLDIAARMRGLVMIASGFYKALKRENVKNTDRIKHYLDYWKGFTLRTFDYTELTFKNVDPETFTDLEKKYKVWPTVVRTTLHLSQKFLRKASEITGLSMLTKDLKVQQKHMQTAELVLATNIEDMMLHKMSQEARTFTLGTFSKRKKGQNFIFHLLGLTLHLLTCLFLFAPFWPLCLSGITVEAVF